MRFSNTFLKGLHLLLSMGHAKIAAFPSTRLTLLPTISRKAYSRIFPRRIDDRPAGLLSHADGSGVFPEARRKLTALSWEEIRLALMLDIGLKLANS
jgi:hypothetical protein